MSWAPAREFTAVMDGSRTAAAAPQGLSLRSPSSSVSSADSPILLDLTSPSAVATEAWRLVDRWQAEAMLAMDMASGAHAESWRQELRQELALMLKRLDAHVDGPCDHDVMRSSPSQQPSQPSIASSISTEQETPDMLDAQHRVRRPVSPTFDTEEQSSGEEQQSETGEVG